MTKHTAHQAMHTPLTDLQQQLQLIKHQFADSIWRGFILIVLVGLPLSISRAWNTGWLPLYNLQLAIGLAILVIALLCSHMSLRIKSLLLLLTFWLIGFPGVLTFGFASPGIWWLLSSCLIAFVLFSAKSAIMIALVTLLGLSLTAVGFVSGVITLQMDVNDYLVSASAWATYIIVNSIVFFVVIRGLQSFAASNQMIAQHQFRQWIDDLPLGVVVRGADQKPYYQNHAATELLGSILEPEAAMDKLLISGSNQPYPVEQLPAIRALRGETCHIDNLDIEHNGQRRSVQAWGRPGYNEEGELAFGIAAFEDITERKRLEQMKNQFIATVSHELRTPLTAIRGALSLMQSGGLGETSSTMQQMLNIAERNSARLLTLINDLLDMQKLEAGQMRFQWADTELIPLLQGSLEQMQNYASQHQIQFKFSTDMTDVWLQADANRLLQVLLNLLSNAAKFSPEQGTVKLSLYPAPMAAMIRIEVQDRGSGIPEDFKNKIFQPFSQSDAADNRAGTGTGLGLSISKAIVEQHSGQISFQCTAEHGTQFFVDLPWASKASTDSAVSAVTHPLN